jgi:hypothetical protein
MRMEIAPSIDWRGIEKGKILQALGKQRRLRHPCRAHEDRDNRNGIAQRGLDLKADEVGLVIYSSTAAFVGTKPTLADNDQQDVTLGDRFTYVHAKVPAKWNIVDVHKDRVLAITAGEAIPNPTCDYIGIGTAV